MNLGRNILFELIIILICVFTGCTAVDSLGVKGMPYREGLYVGIRDQQIYTQENEKVFEPYADIGYILN